MASARPSPKYQLEIINDIGGFTHDPLGYVLYAFPWGEGDLKGKSGPRDWQREVLTEIGAKLRSGAASRQEVIQEATASGHGVGKSCLVAWIILWAMSTCEDTRGVVTASTDNQLRTKTWPEVAKWYRLSINSWMFDLTATKICSIEPDRAMSWRIDILPWSENNTEAFAGLHNEGKRILLIFDEGSGVADKIWEVAEGALTDENTEIIWCVFGNPTKNTGRFRECFGRFAHRWSARRIDSRTVEGTNKPQLDKWIADWGLESDFVRVRVLGEFPKASDMQFIPGDMVSNARTNEARCDLTDPMILGVDVARFGEDQSVIIARKGRDARTFGLWKYRGMDTMQLAARVIEIAQQLKADAIFVDEGGVGGGVIDRLRMLNMLVTGVQFGGKPDRTALSAVGAAGEKYANKRAEMWGAMRAGLKDGLSVPDDSELGDELISVEYGFNIRDEIILESKEQMKARGMRSPDIADSLALTYSYPVIPLSLRQATGRAYAALSDYDPLDG